MTDGATGDARDRTMNDIASVVIVGGGIAGVTVARELRAGGFDRAVTIVEGEPACYDRPPLTKAAFVDGASLESIAFATPDVYATERIEVRVNARAVAISPPNLDGAGQVRLADGSVLDADAIVIATGVRARPPAFPGSNLSAVGVLRDYADAVRTRALARPGAAILVAGAGLIGAELTSGLVALGVRVTLVDPHPMPGAPVLGDTLGGYLHSMHAAHGVDVRQAIVDGVVEAGDRLVVTLDDGATIDADAVVVGAGVTVDPTLALSAGIADHAAGGAIVVDDAGQTAVQRIWAAGDATWRRDTAGGLVPSAGHWEAARLDGIAVAVDILGGTAPTRGACSSRCRTAARPASAPTAT